MPRKKNYFNEDTDFNILRFQLELNKDKRRLIYIEKIQPKFQKLIQNIINVFKYYEINGKTVKDLSAECESQLYSKLKKFDVKKGKAFSYFSIICKNFLTILSQKEFKNITTNIKIQILPEDKEEFLIYNAVEDEIEKKERLYFISDYIKDCIYDDQKLFPLTSSYTFIALSITNFIKDVNNISGINKKEFYNYIKTKTSGTSNYVINNIISSMSVYYQNAIHEYNNL